MCIRDSRYDYGYEYELTENAMYNGYTYDRTTGDIVVSAPYGSSTTDVYKRQVRLRADCRGCQVPL